jgi:ABC-type multidrug transport system fused ATPase/permease subunit
MKNSKLINKILLLLKLVQINNNKIIQIAILSFFVGVFEVLSVGLLIPYLKIFINPSEALKKWEIFTYISISSNEELINISTFIFTVILVLGAILKYTLMSLTIRLTFSTGLNLTSKIFSNVINQNYLYHIGSQSSELIDAISLKTNNIVYLAVMPFISLVSSVLILILFSSVFFIVFFEIALILIFIVVIIYLLVIKLFSKRIKSISERIATSSATSVKIIQECLDNIKDIILSKNKDYVHNSFIKNEKILKSAQAEHSFITLSPKIIIELTGLLSIVLIAFLYSNELDVSYELLPAIAAAAFASQKILPLLAQIYVYWSNLKGQENTIEVVNDYLLLDNSLNLETNTHLNFDKCIRIDKVSYSYNNKKNIISDLDFKIEKGSKVCIIGKSGGGKTTFINLILGLFLPTSGNIYIDDKKLTSENTHIWRNYVSHVPQAVFIADDTIVRNIALCSIDISINYSRINDIIEFVGLTEYVNSLPLGVETFLGESGAILSGGQRQRIGIARALYKQTEVIILDESTSSLDPSSEVEILKKLLTLPNKTIILITHNINNYLLFDKILDFNDFMNLKNS